MNKDAILEIGTEEIPSSFLPPAIKQMEELTAKCLLEEGLESTKIETFATPRRLIVYIHKLPEKTAEKKEEIIGPPLRIAKDQNGNFTKAGLGFANSQNVSPESLQIKTTEKGDYLLVIKHHKGQNTVNLLPLVFSKIISSICFPKAMAWNDSMFRFARPIRNILALYGNRHVRFSTAGIKSTNYTYGFFTSKLKKFKIPSSEKYMQILRNNYIIIDQELRKEAIRKLAGQAVKTISGKIKYSEKLLDEVNYLVECPSAIVGEFDKSFLKLPEEIIITCLEKNQKFFAITDKNGKLMNYFLATRNGVSEYQDIVKEGYERVVSARLKDAEFFYIQDTKIPLASRADKLKGIMFQQKLGTIYDKVQRIRELTNWIKSSLNLSNEENLQIDRIISLCKNDLVTEMVYEYPELQGIIGRYYALYGGESPEVAKAIEEHHWPLYAQGELPKSLLSSVISIADKIDTVVSNFTAGLIPSGSADPYGLRKQSIGVLRILIEKNIRLDLSKLTEKAFNLLAASFDAKDKDKSTGLARAFISQRFENMLEEKGYKIDEIRSVLSLGLNDIIDTEQKIKAVRDIRTLPEFESFIILYKRTANIIKQADKLGIKEEEITIDPAKLLQEEERALYLEYTNILGKTEPLKETKDYLELLKILVTLRQPIDNFFDKILVMDKDESLRNNRLILLKKIAKLFLQVADFSVLQ